MPNYPPSSPSEKEEEKKKKRLENPSSCICNKAARKEKKKSPERDPGHHKKKTPCLPFKQHRPPAESTPNKQQFPPRGGGEKTPRPLQKEKKRSWPARIFSQKKGKRGKSALPLYSTSKKKKREEDPTPHTKQKRMIQGNSQKGERKNAKKLCIHVF